MKANNVLLFFTALLFFYVANSLYSQKIDEYFRGGASFEQHEIIGNIYPGGGFTYYELDDWKLDSLLRSPFLNDFLPQEVIKSIISSNQLTYNLTDGRRQVYHVKGVEVFFNKRIPLSTLGYKLIRSPNVSSNYFIIAYFGRVELGTEIRLISYFDKSNSFHAEIITNNHVYSLRSDYKKYNNNSATVVDSNLPALLIMERLDSSILGITNIDENNTLWISTKLSSEERKVVHFTTSIFQSIRFFPKTTNLIGEHDNFIKNKAISEEEDVLINENSIQLPFEIGNVESESLD